MIKTISLFVLLVTGAIGYAQSDTSLLLIKKNYSRINAIKKWTKVKEVIDYKAYDEGLDNKVTLFYTANNLEKIKVILYREMFKKETQYYFLNNELSLVVDNLISYQKPYQTKNAKILTDKLYFKRGRLLDLVKEQDSGLDMPSNKEVYDLFQEEVIKIKKASKE
ncbi:MAG: hypothetical protein H0U95_04450 [Bacteroidetes bacterium]|nr:hypothetical protein [Bacteroidota bacterium]